MAQKKLNKGVYEAELSRLQSELVDMQEWVRSAGARIVVIFEGRDAAGKGGAIIPDTTRSAAPPCANGRAPAPAPPA